MRRTGELYCVSRGRLADKDAIELRAKFKTLDLASVAFYMIDESRITFVSPSTGFPLHTSITQNAFGLPKETVQSFLALPTQNADILTMIYRLRQAGGTGSLTMQEGEKVYNVTFQPGLAEKQKTDAGEFDTTGHHGAERFFHRAWHDECSRESHQRRGSRSGAYQISNYLKAQSGSGLRALRISNPKSRPSRLRLR
jgi:hypothetical protein